MNIKGTVYMKVKSLDNPCLKRRTYTRNQLHGVFQQITVAITKIFLMLNFILHQIRYIFFLFSVYIRINLLHRQNKRLTRCTAYEVWIYCSYFLQLYENFLEMTDQNRDASLFDFGRVQFNTMSCSS